VVTASTVTATLAAGDFTVGTGTLLTNYVLPTAASGPGQISPRNATWTTNPSSKTYGDMDPNPLTTGSGSNFVAADGVTATYSRVAGENASPPTHHITATLGATPASAVGNSNVTYAGAEFRSNKSDATWKTGRNNKI